MKSGRLLLWGAVVLGWMVSPATAQPPCQDAEPAWGVVGGASLYLLRPYLDNNTAFRTTTIVTDTAGSLTTTSGQTATQQLDWDVTPAVGAWLGVISPSGVGVRSRYFHFNGHSSTTDTSLTPEQAATPAGTLPAVSTFISPSPFVPSFLPGALPPAVAGASSFGSPGAVLQLINPATGSGIGQDNLTFSSNLTIDAVDVEPVYAWTAGMFQMIAGAGGRYLHLSQNYRAALFNNGGGLPISETQTLTLGRNFNGGGPTVSGQVACDLGSTGLALFGSARGSLLVGRSSQQTTFTQDVNDPTGLSGVPGTPVQTRITSQIPSGTDTVLPVAEFELGLEYALTMMQTRWFFRGAVVSQTYFDAGNASRSDGNLSLFGCQMSVGANY